MEIEKSTPLILKFTLNEEEALRLFSFHPVDTATAQGASIRIQMVQTGPPPLAQPVAAPSPQRPHQTPGEVKAAIESDRTAMYRDYRLSKTHLAYRIDWYYGGDPDRCKIYVGKTGSLEDLMRVIDGTYQ